MEYKVTFKGMEQGDRPDEGYTPISSNLQYKVPKVVVPANIHFRLGILLSTMTSGNEDAIKVLIPSGKTIDVILTD